MPLKSKVFGSEGVQRTSIYVRHGHVIHSIPNAELTAIGRGALKKRIFLLNGKAKPQIRSSPELRASQTAEEVKQRVGGDIVYEELLGSERLVKNKRAFDAYFKRGRNWANFLRDWLDGKLNGFTVSPGVAVNEIIRSIEVSHKVYPNLAVNITHSMILEALLEKLTGRRYESLLGNRTGFNPKEIDFGDGFIIYFSGSKVTLEFRKNHYSVTKRFNALVHSNK